MRLFALAAVFAMLPAAVAAAPSPPADAFEALHWRMIGPFRGGRTRACAGVPGQSNVFYMAPVNGGVWKTDDAGRTWRPIFDGQPTQSIGSIAVAPSNPNILYAGSGEGLLRPDLSVGNGVYRSTDAGTTWTHVGLDNAQQIPQLAVDPRNPNRVFAAVLGHPYGPSDERGVYRSLDGGKTWKQVLYKNDNTGASDIAIDPKHPDVVYAAMWEARLGAVGGRQRLSRHERRPVQVDRRRHDVAAAARRLAGEPRASRCRDRAKPSVDRCTRRCRRPKRATTAAARATASIVRTMQAGRGDRSPRTTGR